MPNTITETTIDTKFDLAAIQQALRENKVDDCLFYDHHNRDPLSYSIHCLDPSAYLISTCKAVLTAQHLATYFVAQQRIAHILDAAWKEIGARARNGGTDEHAMVQYLQQAMSRETLVWEHGPNVSAGPNSADSHYEPTAANSRPIRKADFVLLDIWAQPANQPTSAWYDITWTGVVNREPTERDQLIFHTVRDARDAPTK